MQTSPSTAYKRRSPPPNVPPRSSAASPSTESPSPVYTPDPFVSHGSTSSIAPRASNPTLKGKPRLYPNSAFPLTATIPTTANGTMNGIGAMNDSEDDLRSSGEASSSHVIRPTSAIGPYAYSTTLRRQVSVDPLPFHSLPHLPHHALHRVPSNRHTSPKRKPHGGILNGSASPYEEERDGLLRRALRAGRRLLRQDVEYEELGQEEEMLASSIHRAAETPSAIYAHRSIEQTIDDFHTHPKDGLSPTSLSGLLSRYGPNEFELPPSDPLWLKFLKGIYETPLILLLLGSSAVSAIMGQYDDAVCVVLTVAIVLTVGFVQEQRSEKSLEALNKLVPHYCHLIRNGQAQTPLANALLPGDLVTFSVGDRIPADIRLITAVALEIDESALTGETRPARKNTEMCERGEGEDTHGEGGGKALGERHCMAFMGTLVRSGHGSGIVVGTGKETEFGVVFSMMQEVEEKKTPLQLMMDDLAKRLSLFSFGVIGIIFLVGVLQHRDWLEMFTIGVSLAVAAIPEGLPIVTTVTLALGVLRMSKRKAIVKKLPTVEALGSVNVICSDKTGTLTTNEMTVTHVYAVDDLIDLSPYLHHTYESRNHGRDVFRPPPAFQKAALVGNLCNNAFRNEHGVNIGQPTEVALLNVLPILGVEDSRKKFTQKSEIPFSSDTKTMTVIGSLSGGADTVYLKGAVEAVLAQCRYYYVTDTSTPALDASVQKEILKNANEVSTKGLRVLAMAYGLPPKDPEATAKDLVFVGFQAMMDPPRRGVLHAVSALHGAGVQVVMITGDAEPTALAIARQLGLKVTPSSGLPNGLIGASSCMLGSQLDALSERELVERVPGITVFARTTPRHKMAIVKAWQMRGATVAMTGDGVNDSPALKMADIGISMGKSGTDVAKEAADVILVNDDFSSILPAVEEGKSIFYNIQNFLSFQLSTAVAALTLITLSTFLGLANPLNAMQILFINILMDGPPAQALGVDPVDKEIMRRPPRKKGTSIISRRLMLRVAFSATMIVAGTLFVFVADLSDGQMDRRDQTMTFTVFVFLDLVSALQNRGLTCPLFRNRMLFITITISFFCQLGLIYIPLLQHIFQTEALSARDLLVLLGLASTSLVLHEGRRWWERSIVEKEIFEATIGGMA